MTSPSRELQTAAVAAALQDSALVAAVASTANGPAVFARGQAFPDVFPRVTLGAPQRLDRSTSCGVAGDFILTLHSWARGPDCTLVAAELADAVIAALLGSVLVLNGWRVTGRALTASRPVGDPDPATEHFVTDIRFTLHRAA